MLTMQSVEHNTSYIKLKDWVLDKVSWNCSGTISRKIQLRQNFISCSKKRASYFACFAESVAKVVNRQTKDL